MLLLALLHSALAEDNSTLIAEAIQMSAGEMRGILMVAGLEEAYGSDLDPQLLSDLKRMSEGEAPDSAVLREAHCPRGRDQDWALPLIDDWSGTMAALWKRCRLERAGLLTEDDFLHSAGPDASLLGSALYTGLLDAGADPDASRTLGRMVAGLPPDPRVGLPRDRRGAVGLATAGITLPTSTATRPLATGCIPVVGVTVGGVTVDGRSVVLDSLPTALSACRELPASDGVPRFRGRLALAVAPDVSAGTVLSVMEQAQQAGYDAVGVLIRPGTGSSGAPEPAADEHTPLAIIDVVLAAEAAPAPPPAPRSEKGSKAGGKGSKSGSSSGGMGSLIGAAVPDRSAAPALQLRPGTHTLVLDGVAQSPVPADPAALQAALKEHKATLPDEEVITISVADAVLWGDVVGAMDAARDDGPLSGPASAEAALLFPMVALSRLGE